MHYNVSNEFGGTKQAMSTTSNLSVLSLLAQTATLRRGRVQEMTFGPFSNPAATDCNLIYGVYKQTADTGTGGTAVTPKNVDPQEGGTPPAAGALCKVNYSANPTLDVDALFGISMNQHSSFQWYAPEANTLEWVALNANGFAFTGRAATTDFTGTVYWRVRFEE
jgi:hypothetical protein